MNVNTLTNRYWLFRPFTWFSIGIGAMTLIGYLVWLSIMLQVAAGS
jgi:hypothetical protein